MIKIYTFLYSFVLLIFSNSIFCSQQKINNLICFTNKHFHQIKVFDQIEYEVNPHTDELKPSIIKKQKGLCGIISLYNGICLLKALNGSPISQSFINPINLIRSKSQNTFDWIKKIGTIDGFHEWITNNQIILNNIKNKQNGLLGSLRKTTILKIAQESLSNEEIKYVTSIDYIDITEDVVFWGYQNFSESFKKFYSKPHLVIFNIDHHFIAVVFNKKITWIIDSCNTDLTNDYRIKQLDLFIREKYIIR